MYINELSIHIFVEYQKYKEHDLKTLNYNQIEKNDVIQKANGYIWFKVVGIFVIDSSLIVVMPKGYISSYEYSIKGDIVQLLKVLMQYHELNDKDLVEAVIQGNGLGLKESTFYAAYNLIEDYIHYGLLHRELQNERLGQYGRVNWSKSIASVHPIVSEGKPIYDHVVTITSVDDKTSELLRYQRWALKTSIQRYGWLFDNDDIELDTEVEESIDPDRAIYFLERTLLETYIDRDVRVIQWIINLIEAKSMGTDEYKFECVYTNSFYYLWEDICGQILDNQHNKLRTILPQPLWKFEGSTRKSDISHRPDILLIRNDTFYIFDAKYYDTNENLPGWHDVVKQFFYLLSIKEGVKKKLSSLGDRDDIIYLERISKFENYFIFPTYSTEFLDYIGKVQVPDIPQYGDIHAIQVNMRMAMEAYLKRTTLPIIDRVKSEIKK